MYMANDNCLNGMQCPKCQSFEPFVIESRVTVRVYDDGTEDIIEGFHWEDESYCECCQCEYAATVKDFTVSQKPRLKHPEDK